MKRQTKKWLAAVVAFAMTLCLVNVPAGAKAKAPKLAAKSISLKVGKSKTLTLKNNKKKTKWSITKGKGIVKLSNVKKNSVKITAKKAGNAKVQVKIGSKKLTCTVKVTAKKVVTPAPQKTTIPAPSVNPSVAPTTEPTASPSTTPTTEPSASPSVAPTTEPTVGPSDEPEKPTQYNAFFDIQSEALTVDVYYTQDYSKEADVKGATDAVARNSETGEIDVTGEGQINFKVNAPTGYGIKVEVVPVDRYKNIKYPSEIGVDGVYRVTKITGDITIQISALKADKYIGTFEKGEHVKSIDIFYTQDYTGEPNETDVTSAIARSSVDGAIIVDGKGQINFRANVDEGYVAVATIGDIDAGKYSSLKGKDDTGVEGIFRLTKMTDDITIYVAAVEAPKEDPEEPVVEPTPDPEVSPLVGTITKGEHVTSVDVYYTKDYTAPDETNVTSAKVRNGDTGEIDTSGEGQINIKVTVEEGYVAAVNVTSGTYNAVKLQTEDIYRITKISTDITIEITATEKPKDPFEGTLSLGEHVTSVDVFYTSAYETDAFAMPDESDLSEGKIYARDGEGAETGVAEAGQMNFRVNVEEGYHAVVSVTEGTYKNLKSGEGIAAGVSSAFYRITKVKGNLTITITAEPNAVAEETE